jgi:hypothetical protein
MLRTPAILGISMAPRRNRRLLVALTYVALLVLMVIISIFPIPGFRDNVLGTALVLGYCAVGLGVFGRLVEETVLPQVRGGEMTSLGLTPRRRDVDEPDERDVAIRNAAYFVAYRALAVYLAIICAGAQLGFESLTGSGAVVAFRLLALPVLAMAFTLPQAIILWNEPDVPEEARI